ncbi:MAG: GAF domain-containing protein [Rhodospirillales bacterium]|nr:GAF domain-containing protein [Rhodospirillales bacterium]
MNAGGKKKTATPKPKSAASESALTAKERKRLQRAEMLLELSQQVASIESLDDVLETLVDFTCREVGSERGTLFLNDEETGELYARVATGNLKREIRLLNTSGIAGEVFTDGVGEIVHDAYSHPHFNHTIDSQTGYVTRNLLCAPIKTARRQTIGVAQLLNKKRGRFTKEDLALLEAMTTQASVALQSTRFAEQVKLKREQELKFLDVVADVTSDIELDSLLQKVMTECTRMLNSERSTLFLNDAKTGELFSRVAQGDSVGEIRLPNTAGIAGHVFSTGESVNIPYAYADLRFNPAFDKKTGFFTRSILCVPVVNKEGRRIGVTQVLNRHGGPFTDEDEQRLKAFTAQVAIGLENAKLFEDVQNMKNYNEAMLESMSNGVITVDEDLRIVTCNAAAGRITGCAPDKIIGMAASAFFADANAWIVEKTERVLRERISEVMMDAELHTDAATNSVNLTVLPLINTEDKNIGGMLMLEDISAEKRVKSTMSRYMDPGLADQLVKGGEDVLGGKGVTATILFSDIRSFTTLTEELGAQGTVSLLNEYFTIMVDCIQREGGMLDKFIGDAIMAAFGLPLAHDDDEDRAVRAAIAMIRELWAWNAKRAEDGKKPVDMGIGLNTDMVVSGNIGSPKRMDYTVIGDGVNLASRLESACKQYGARILISEHTAEKLRGTYRIRDVDHVVVKGKTEPVAVFEVLDYHSDQTFPQLMDAVAYCNEGIRQYRTGNWDTALKSFAKLKSINPDDKLCALYIDRCKTLKAKPPKDWNGVWTLKAK